MRNELRRFNVEVSNVYATLREGSREWTCASAVIAHKSTLSDLIQFRRLVEDHGCSDALVYRVGDLVAEGRKKHRARLEEGQRRYDERLARIREELPRAAIIANIVQQKFEDCEVQPVIDVTEGALTEIRRHCSVELLFMELKSRGYDIEYLPGKGHWLDEHGRDSGGLWALRGWKPSTFPEERCRMFSRTIQFPHLRPTEIEPGGIGCVWWSRRPYGWAEQRTLKLKARWYDVTEAELKQRSLANIKRVHAIFFGRDT